MARGKLFLVETSKYEPPLISLDTVVKGVEVQVCVTCGAIWRQLTHRPFECPVGHPQRRWSTEVIKEEK